MRRHIVTVRDGMNKVQMKVVVRSTRKWVYVTRVPADPDEPVGPRGGTGFHRDRLFEFDQDVHARLLAHESAGRDPWLAERDALKPFSDAEDRAAGC